MGLQLTRGAKPAQPTAGSNISDLYLDTSGRINLLGSDGFTHAISDLGVRANLLVNGGFDFAQRQAPATLVTYSNTSGRSYGADRWGLTNENASVQYARVDATGSPPAGLVARYYGQFKKISNAGKVIVSQVLEGSDTAALRGQTLRFQMKARNNVGSATLRMALLQLAVAGTVDSIPATFAAAFGAVGTDPTWGTNLAAIVPNAANPQSSVVGSGLTCVLTTAFQVFGGTFTVPATAKNLVAVIFTNGQPATNDIFELGEVGLFVGDEERQWVPQPIQAELARAQRYYTKTYEVDTDPATQVLPGSLRAIVGKAAAALGVQFHWRFPVPMRAAAPTIVTVNPVTAANTNPRRTGGTAGDETGVATANVNSMSADITATDAASGAVGDAVQVQATADAEL